MKKILLTIAVVGAFLVYGLHQKQEEANVHVTAPTSLQVTPTPTVSDSTGSANPPATPTTSSSASGTSQGSGYKDGIYTGSVADAFYGNVQVQAVIQSGKISDVKFLQYPSDRGTSIEINSQAMPYLKEEAIQAQSANVDIVSGATQTSGAFRQSLDSALRQAKG